MSAKDPLVRLQHILDQIDGIEVATRGLTYKKIIDNFIYERGVERPYKLFRKRPRNCRRNCDKNIPMFIGDRLSELGIY